MNSMDTKAIIELTTGKSLEIFMPSIEIDKFLEAVKDEVALIDIRNQESDILRTVIRSNNIIAITFYKN